MCVKGFSVNLIFFIFLNIIQNSTVYKIIIPWHKYFIIHKMYKTAFPLNFTYA